MERLTIPDEHIDGDYWIKKYSLKMRLGHYVPNEKAKQNNIFELIGYTGFII